MVDKGDRNKSRAPTDSDTITSGQNIQRTGLGNRCRRSHREPSTNASAVQR